MEEKLLNGLKEALEIEDRELSLTDRLKDIPELDSLGQLTVIAMLDEKFNFIIEMEEFNKLDTLSDLLNKIKENS